MEERPQDILKQVRLHLRYKKEHEFIIITKEHINIITTGPHKVDIKEAFVIQTKMRITIQQSDIEVEIKQITVALSKSATASLLRHPINGNPPTIPTKRTE